MNDVEVVAKTLYGEARGEGLNGMLAVACVIRNRVNAKSWYGEDWRGVCLKPWQFSCWNPGDPNRKVLEALSYTDPKLAVAASAADAVINRGFQDITNGANHYCTKAVASRTSWARGETPVATIGNHVFYKL